MFSYLILLLSILPWALSVGILPPNCRLWTRSTEVPDVLLGYYTFNGVTYLGANVESRDTFNIDSDTGALYGDDGRFCVASGSNYYIFANTPGQTKFSVSYVADGIQITNTATDIYLCNIAALGGAVLTTTILGATRCPLVTLYAIPSELIGLLAVNTNLYAQGTGFADVQLGYYTFNGTTYLAVTENSQNKFNVDSSNFSLYSDDGKFCVVPESNYITFAPSPGATEFELWYVQDKIELTYKATVFYLCQSTTLGATVLTTNLTDTSSCRQVSLFMFNPALVNPTDPTDPTGPTGPTNPTGPTGPTVPTTPTGPTTPTRPTTPTSRTTSTGSTNRGTSTSGRTSASRTASTSPTTVRKSSAPTKPTVQETSRREPSDITAPSIAPLFAIDEDGNKISLSTIEILVNATADEIAKRENRKAIAGLTYLVADITDSSGFYIQDGRLYDADGRTAVNQDSKFITFASEGGLIGFEHSENGYLSFRGESNFYYCYLDGGNTTFKAVSLEDTGSCNVTSLILGGSADEGSTMITTVFLFTETRTITECSSTVTDCPGSSKFVHTITTTYCPDTEPGPYTITLYAAVETGDGGDIQTRTFITTIGDTSLSSSVQGSGPTEIPTFNSAGTLTRGLGLVMAACIIFLL